MLDSVPMVLTPMPLPMVPTPTPMEPMDTTLARGLLMLSLRLMLLSSMVPTVMLDTPIWSPCLWCLSLCCLWCLSLCLWSLQLPWLRSSLIPFAQINHNRISNYLLPKLRKTSKYDCHQGLPHDQ